jgi:hypothetical protein
VNTATKKSNKGVIMIFVAVFLLPVILAKFALDNGWFNQAATNKGNLIQPPLNMQPLQTSQALPKWKLVYVMPSQCVEACENALYSITQVWSALGKHSDRAEVVVISHENSDKAQLSKLIDQQKVRILETNQSSINQVFDGVEQGIFVADTMNNVILQYPLQQDKEQAVMDSRDILADMRKVLKLSRIG